MNKKTFIHTIQTENYFRLTLVAFPNKNQIEEEGRMKEALDILKQMNERAKKRGRPKLFEEKEVKNAA